MNRRKFFKFGGFAVFANILNLSAINSDTIRKKLVKPNGLSPGDTVGLITPGFASTEEKKKLAIKKLESLGLKVKTGKHLNGQHGYLAGTDQQRASDLMAMFEDPSIQGIWCLRGGYGSARILPLLDFDIIKNNPKPLIGYSDVTALHLGLFSQSRLVSFHGPVGTSEFSDFAIKGLNKALFYDQFQAKIELSKEQLKLGEREKDYQPYTINPGIAKGQIIGGNLSLISSLIGTPYLPSFKDKIVIIEEIGEKPYRVDRMLVQLIQATDISKASAIVLGVFKDCKNTSEAPSLSIHELFTELIKPLDIPTMYGFSFGHIESNVTIPIGVEAKLDTKAMKFELLDKPFV